jgi:prepilin-type N-terminal cleavage/methylation domain-containing protein
MNGKLLKNITERMALQSKKGPGSKWARGFSLSELMATLSLLGILTALAIPPYEGAIEKRKITNGVEQIVVFVNTVRSESIKRNRLMTVSYAAQQDGSWCIGAVLGRTPCDCTQSNVSEPEFCAVNSAAWLLRDTDVQAKNLISSVSGDGAFAFDPVRGLFVDHSDTLLLGFHSGAGQFQINLSMNATGKVSLCQPGVSDKISGFKACL